MDIRNTIPNDNEKTAGRCNDLVTYIIRVPLHRDDMLFQCILVLDPSLGLEKVQGVRGERIKLVIECWLPERVCVFGWHWHWNVVSLASLR